MKPKNPSQESPKVPKSNNNKIISLQDYRNKILLKQQITELHSIGVEHYHTLSPVEQRGYRNFMKLLKALDSMPSSNTPDEE